MIDRGKVYFIGAGPGAPDLITIRGKQAIDNADVILYTGSMVNPALFETARPDAVIKSSESMTLEQIMDAMIISAKSGNVVARVHTGDPSLFGAILEQITILEEQEIPYEIIPGVSSVFAAAAKLGVELTVPEITQTIILTRVEGRTPVPSLETLQNLAVHQSTIVLFLSVDLIEKVVSDLLAGGYPPETSVAVVHKVTWPDEQIVKGTLAEIASKVRIAGIHRQSLILIGGAINSIHSNTFSKLYDQNFSHGFRTSASSEA